MLCFEQAADAPKHGNTRLALGQKHENTKTQTRPWGQTTKKTKKTRPWGQTTKTRKHGRLAAAKPRKHENTGRLTATKTRKHEAHENTAWMGLSCG